jgi:hypothetical protein
MVLKVSTYCITLFEQNLKSILLLYTVTLLV